MRIYGAILTVMACLALAGVSHAEDDGGAKVVRQMHGQYQGTWFATTRFE